MKKELSMIHIYENNQLIGYGGNQEWFEDLWAQKAGCGTHYIKKVSYRTLIFQVLCCFLLFLLHFCHMALEACFHIFGVKRFDDTNTVVINVDNLIPLAVKIAGG